jgi:hypothetical protein
MRDGVRIFDAHGNDITDRFDTNGVLKDQHKMRVPLMMMDSAGNNLGEPDIADIAAAVQFTTGYKQAFADGVAARTGGKVGTIADDESESFLDGYIAGLVEAADRQEEDSMTTLEDALAIQGGYKLDARSAQLAAIFCNRERQLRGEPVTGPTFVADGVDTTTSAFAAAVTARAMRDESYRAFVAETANAWRTPPAQDAPPVGSTSQPIHDAASAQRTKDEAWLTMVKEMQDAWKAGPS